MAHMHRTRPAVVAFDVVGTLFSLDPLAARMRGVGLRSIPPEARRAGRCRVCRDPVDSVFSRKT